MDHGPWGSRNPPPAEPAAAARPRSRRSIAVVVGLLVCVAAAVWALVRLNPARSLSPDGWSEIGRLALLVALVGTGIASRRLRLAQALRYALGWAAIAAVVLVGFSYRREIASVADHVRGEFLASDAPAAARPHEMWVQRDPDGQFYALGRVNGQPVRFMMDTGSSDVVLSPADARRVGVDPATLTFQGRYETANGVGHGAPWRADSLTVGDLHLTGVAMAVNGAPMSVSLLGASFFKRLDSFEVKDDRFYMRWSE